MSTDPTLPHGIPGDSVAHEANRERVVAILAAHGFHPSTHFGVIPDLAEALTAAEARGAAGAARVVRVVTRLRDMTAKQLDALPEGARFEDLCEPPSRRAPYAFVKHGDQWVSPELTTCSSGRLLAIWCDVEDYRLVESSTP